MKIKKILLLACCVIFLSQCAYFSSRQRVHSKNYALNVETQVVTGSPMVISEFTSYVKGSRGDVLVEEQDSWQSFFYPTPDQSKEEIIYNGRSDGIIRITYREYKKNLSSPRFSQELTYDLGYSDIVEFRHFKIKVLNATSEYVRFVVLSD